MYLYRSGSKSHAASQLRETIEIRKASNEAVSSAAYQALHDVNHQVLAQKQFDHQILQEDTNIIHDL